MVPFFGFALARNNINNHHTTLANTITPHWPVLYKLHGCNCYHNEWCASVRSFWLNSNSWYTTVYKTARCIKEQKRQYFTKWAGPSNTECITVVKTTIKMAYCNAYCIIYNIPSHLIQWISLNCVTLHTCRPPTWTILSVYNYIHSNNN